MPRLALSNNWFFLAVAAMWILTAIGNTVRRKRAGRCLLVLDTQYRQLSRLSEYLLLIGGLAGFCIHRTAVVWAVSLFALAFVLVKLTDYDGSYLTENGVVVGGGRLLRWEKIAEYEVTAVDTLSIRREGSETWAFLCELSRNQRAAAGRILAEKCPGKVVVAGALAGAPPQTLTQRRAT